MKPLNFRAIFFLGGIFLITLGFQLFQTYSVENFSQSSVSSAKAAIAKAADKAAADKAAADKAAADKAAADKAAADQAAADKAAAEKVAADTATMTAAGNLYTNMPREQKIAFLNAGKVGLDRMINYL
jgi:hypothetical protein